MDDPVRDELRVLGGSGSAWITWVNKGGRQSGHFPVSDSPAISPLNNPSFIINSIFG